jgi:hypothetical protein
LADGVAFLAANPHAQSYSIEKNTEVIWPVSCRLGRMQIAARSSRVGWDGLDKALIAMLVGSLALAVGLCPMAARGSAQGPTAHSLIPAQVSMGRPVRTIVPPAKTSNPPGQRTAAPVNPETGLTPAQQKRLVEVMNLMTPKERKRLVKAMKRMTPEQRRKFAAMLTPSSPKRRTVR